MAQALYGSVYFHQTLAGILREEPDSRYSFAYRPEYLESGGAAIASTLPLRIDPHYSDGGLHPFFDNLVAEGWLANAQARALGLNSNDRFGRLLAFGHDCVGAASIIDPRPRSQPNLDAGTAEEIAALASRASLSGVQPKLLAVKTDAGYRPAKPDEASTHIAKMPSGQLPGIVDLEYLTTVAAAHLLSGDRTVELEVADVAGVRGPCLAVRRFDRGPDGSKIHFEEFTQLLNRPSEAKYDGSYGEMAAYIRTHPRCRAADIDFLFRRVLACILLGNSDAHMKNFGLLYEGAAMRLSPAYDLVAAGLYPEFDSQLALRISDGANPRNMASIGPKHVEALAKAFGFGRGALLEAVHDFEIRLETAEEAVRNAPIGHTALKKKLAAYMRKRWNGTFRRIGKKAFGSKAASSK